MAHLVELKVPKFDVRRYTRAVQAATIRLFKDAIGEFVKKIVFDELVPVDTGMSAASLHDAAVAAKMWGSAQSAIMFRRKHIRRKGLTTMSGNYDASRYREIKEGIKVASKATKIVIEYPRLEFNFDIQVFQWYLHEIVWNNWSSIDPAIEAYIEFIDKNMFDYLPNLLGYLD